MNLLVSSNTMAPMVRLIIAPTSPALRDDDSKSRILPGHLPIVGTGKAISPIDSESTYFIASTFRLACCSETAWTADIGSGEACQMTVASVQVLSLAPRPDGRDAERLRRC